MNLFEEFFDRRSLYFDAFDKVSEAVYVCDTEENLIYINKAAERLDGYLLKDIKGRPTRELYELNEPDTPMLRALATERPVNNQEYSYYVNDKKVIQFCNAAPIYADGKLVGAYTVQRDLTLFKNMVEQNIALQRAIVHQASTAGSDASADSLAQRIVGSSKSMMRCKELAVKAAKTNSSVMLVGNTGSGKEVFAHVIHDGSSRVKKPFLALNCAAIPETLIEGILFGTTKGVYTGAVEKDGILAQADGGTVFLDEINSMPLASQAKLLRVLEEKKIMKLGSNKEQTIDIRIISSINESPQEAFDKGHMRSDLFYRLSVIQIFIPPLKERKEDIPELVYFFVKKYNKQFHKNVLGVEDDVMNYFVFYHWPGNVRQLKACVESAMNFTKDGRRINLSDLPMYIFENNESPGSRYQQRFSGETRGVTPEEQLPSPRSFNEGHDMMDAIHEEEKQEIIAAMRKSKGNMTKAAAALGLSRQSLSYRLKKYHLK